VADPVALSDTEDLMSVVLIGSNPGLLLLTNDHPTAVASVWMVDWSRWGRGDVIVVATPDGWLTAGADEHFARILADRFTRHFPEAETFDWDGHVEHIDEKPSVRLNAATGVRASAEGLKVEITGVLDRRHISEPAYELDGALVSLSNVYLPCARGSITVRGELIAGEPNVGGTEERPSSSAFLAVAEVWTDPHGALGLPDRPTDPELATFRRRHLRSLRREL